MGERTSRLVANATICARYQRGASMQILAVQHLQCRRTGVKSLAHLGHILCGLLHGEGQTRIHIRSLLRLLVEEHETLSLLIVVLLPAQGQFAGDPFGATRTWMCPL